MTNENRIDIIPCPRCIHGQMFYDIHLHEYDCIDCGYTTYVSSKITVPSILKSSGGVAQGNFPKYNDRGVNL